jgi:hypothetical protein
VALRDAKLQVPERLEQIARTTDGRRCAAREGDDMASKDKGGKSSKTAAAKTPKEKRDAKRDKKQAKERDERSA